MRMLLSILEFALTAIVLVILIKELLWPMVTDKPLFPSIRKAMGQAKNTEPKE